MMKNVTPVQYNELRCAFDPEKLNAYESFIKDSVKGKVVCDLGAGCGVLSFLALYHGASRVILLDQNKAALERAEELIGDKGQYIVCNLKEDDLPEADIYIHEIYGSALYEEGIIDIFENLRRQGIENKCFPNVGEFFSYSVQKLTTERYNYDINHYNEGTQAYHKLLTEEEIGYGTRTNMSCRSYDYKEKKVLNSFDLTVDKGSRYIYNMLEMVPYLGWRSYFPNGAAFSNIPREGNNWYLLTEDDKERYIGRLNLTYKTTRINNPYEEH